MGLSLGTFTVVGVVREIGSLGGAYVARARPEWAPAARLATLRGAPPATDIWAQRDLVASAEAALLEAGVEVRATGTSAARNRGLYDHVILFARTLALMAALLAAVGGIGLASALGLNILERTRELGVLRSLGAGRRAIASTVLLEAAALGASSWALAALVSVPLTILVGVLTGIEFVGAPLPLTLAGWGYAAALAGTLVVAILASLAPARAAQSGAVKRTLAFA